MHGKIRRFRADYVKGDNGTGVSIVEYGELWDGETLAIQSLYDPRILSNQDISLIIFERIYQDLQDDEGAVLQMFRYNRSKNWCRPYTDKMNIQHIKTERGRMYQAELLAADAIKRKSDICEVFEEPFAFYPVYQQIEESRDQL